MQRVPRRFGTPLVLAALTALPFACSAGSGDERRSDSGSGSSGGTLTGGNTGGFDGGPDGSGAGCVQSAEDVYVVDQSNGLWRFRPGLLSFSKIGDLKCPASPAATPFSMGIDRTAGAWVLYSDGALFDVSTEDASCKSTSYQTNQSGYVKFGMGFVSDAPGSPEETLFISKYVENGGTAELASLSVQSFKIAPIGPITPNGAPEFTGTGDAKLWGFFNRSVEPPVLAELDKTTGKAKSQKVLDSIEANFDAWAFAHWGGDFYIFTASLFSGNGSKVTHYDPDADAQKVVIASTIDVGGPSRIVGAGVSTCAPLKPVN